MDPGGSPTPWTLAMGAQAGGQAKAAEEEPLAHQRDLLDIDIDEPLLLVGAFNDWGKGFPENGHDDFRFMKAEGTSARDERESHVFVRHTSTKLSFKIISARRGWHCQIYPSGEGESLKELRLGSRLPARISRDHQDEAAHGRNFRIWERKGQSVDVRVLLSRREGIKVWYERVQFSSVSRFKDAPHLMRHVEVECTRLSQEPLLRGLAMHFGAEGWAHSPQFGLPESIMREVQKEAASLNMRMLPGLTGADFKKSYAPVPKSRTDRIVWVDDNMLATHPGLRQLSEALVRFVHLLAGELEHEGQTLGVGSHNRPMLAVYDEGCFFKEHLDVTTVGDPRILSAVYYLNPNWNKADGGALRLRPREGRFVDIWPDADSLVVFRSDKILHEVRKSKARRLALTIWFNSD